jgi:hypothetical protein
VNDDEKQFPDEEDEDNDGDGGGKRGGGGRGGGGSARRGSSSRKIGNSIVTFLTPNCNSCNLGDNLWASPLQYNIPSTS